MPGTERLYSAIVFKSGTQNVAGNSLPRHDRRNQVIFLTVVYDVCPTMVVI